MNDKKLRNSIIGLAISTVLFGVSITGLVIAKNNNPLVPVIESQCNISNIYKETVDETDAIRLQWECWNCSPTSYQLFRRINGSGELAPYIGVDFYEKHYTDSDIETDTLYEYSVAAYDRKAEPGSRCGPLAKSVFFYYSTTADVIPLEEYMPDLNITTTSDGFKLSWAHVPNAPLTEYRVERYIDNEWETAAVLPANTLSFEEMPEGDARYRLTAVNNATETLVESQTSNIADATILPCKDSVTEIQNIALKDENIHVAWYTPNTFPSSYQIFRGQNGEPLEFYKAIHAEESFYHDSNITDKILYAYSVAAFDSNAESGSKMGNQSQVVYFFYDKNENAASIGQTAPAITAATSENDVISITWSAPANVPLTHYRVEKLTSGSWTEIDTVTADKFSWQGNADAENYRVIGIFEQLDNKLETLPSSNALNTSGGEK